MKKIYVDGFVFMPSHIYMCPIPSLPLIGENIIIFSNEMF